MIIVYRNNTRRCKVCVIHDRNGYIAMNYGTFTIQMTYVQLNIYSDNMFVDNARHYHEKNIPR